jgi:hypothetical protein
MISPTDPLLEETLSGNRSSEGASLDAGLSALRWRRRRRSALPVLAGLATILTFVLTLPRPQPRTKATATAMPDAIHTSQTLAPVRVPSTLASVTVVRSASVDLARIHTAVETDQVVRLDRRRLFALFEDRPVALVNDGTGTARLVVFR